MSLIDQGIVTENSICCIVLIYHPDFSRLYKLLANLSTQVEDVVVVDNTDVGKSKSLNIPDVKHLVVGENVGVAEGFNLGINWATENGFKYVLLMDQDSFPNPDMVSQLMNAYIGKGLSGEKVAAVGPNYLDPNYKAIDPFNSIHRFWISRTRCDKSSSTQEILPADYLISSGSLIPVSVLNDVGLMDSGLFIDYVDTEWGIRAKSKGYCCYGVCAAKMVHALGVKSVEFWCGKSWSVPIHTPYRHYYYFRNALLMYRNFKIPTVWKIRDAVMLFLKIFFFTLVVAPRLERLKYIVRGIYHGLIGKSGRMIS